MTRLPALAALAAALLLPAPALDAKECVILLHGLGRTPASMLSMQLALQGAGYDVRNTGYPSRSAAVEALAPVVGAAIADCEKAGASAIHFVTHSMGGILVRAYFQDRAPTRPGRVVMLAPPNRGSEVVDRNQDAWWFKAATGPAGQQLGTRGLPGQLEPIALEVGVIAGAQDGKVSVASARLEGMKDFLVVDGAHTLIMNSPEVIAQVRHFLQQGAFERPSPARSASDLSPRAGRDRN